MNEEVGALGQVMLVQQSMLHVFLRTLLARLAVDVPDFDARAFVDSLYIFQEHLPMPESGQPDDYQAQCKVGLAEWGKLIALSEDAIKTEI